MNRSLISNRWGSRIAVVMVGGAIVLATFYASGSDARGGAFASEARAAGVQRSSEGGLSGVRVVADSDADRHADQRRGYDPSIAYPGFYDPQRVYKVVLGPQTWRANRSPAQVRDVTCRDAKSALERRGEWTGRLIEDGSCISGDETQWATGNFLNFQAGPHTTNENF